MFKVILVVKTSCAVHLIASSLFCSILKTLFSFNSSTDPKSANFKTNSVSFSKQFLAAKSLKNKF